MPHGTAPAQSLLLERCLSFFWYLNTRFIGLLSSSTHNIIFAIIVFLSNFILSNSTLIPFSLFLLFSFFLTCLLDHTTLLCPCLCCRASVVSSPLAEFICPLASPIPITPTGSSSGGAASVVNTTHNVKVADDKTLVVSFLLQPCIANSTREASPCHRRVRVLTQRAHHGYLVAI
jgi:hypothetical protein